MVESWEEVTISLLQRAEEDKRRAESRMEAAQRALEEVETRMRALGVALEAFRAQYGSRPVAQLPDPVLREQYQDKSVRDMMIQWARAHGGRIEMKEAAHAFTSMGLFSDERQAAGTMYPTARRTEGFKKVGRGLYMYVDAKVAEIPEQVEESTPSFAVLRLPMAR